MLVVLDFGALLPPILTILAGCFGVKNLPIASVYLDIVTVVQFDAIYQHAILIIAFCLDDSGARVNINGSLPRNIGTHDMQRLRRQLPFQPRSYPRTVPRLR